MKLVRLCGDGIGMDRCQLPEGHAGDHRAGGLWWANQEWKARELARRRATLAREHRAAKLLRAFLVEALGHRCACCGRRRARWHLDHPKGRTWKVRSLSRLARMRRYLADYLAGNLRLLCHACNERDGAHRRWRLGKYRAKRAGLDRARQPEPRPAVRAA